MSGKLHSYSPWGKKAANLEFKTRAGGEHCAGVTNLCWHTAGHNARLTYTPPLIVISEPHSALERNWGEKRKLGAIKQHMQPGNSSGVGCLNALRCASRCWRSGSPPAGLLCREKPPRSPDQPVTFSGHLGGALGSTGERHPSPGRGGGGSSHPTSSLRCAEIT